MSMVDPDELILMGRVMRGHGIRGEMKVFCETEDPRRFERLDRVFIGHDIYTTESYAVASVRYQEHAKKGTIVLLKLEEIEDRTEADRLQNAQIYSTTEELPPLEEGQLFLHDLVGLRVETEDGATIGEVKDIMRLPAHDTFVISRDDASDVLVPDVDEFVVSLDMEQRLLRISPIEGLLD